MQRNFPEAPEKALRRDEWDPRSVFNPCHAPSRDGKDDRDLAGSNAPVSTLTREQRARHEDLLHATEDCPKAIPKQTAK